MLDGLPVLIMFEIETNYFQNIDQYKFHPCRIKNHEPVIFAHRRYIVCNLHSQFCLPNRVSDTTYVNIMFYSVLWVQHLKVKLYMVHKILMTLQVY